MPGSEMGNAIFDRPCSIHVWHQHVLRGKSGQKRFKGSIAVRDFVEECSFSLLFRHPFPSCCSNRPFIRGFLPASGLLQRDTAQQAKYTSPFWPLCSQYPHKISYEASDTSSSPLKKSPSSGHSQLAGTLSSI